VKLTRSTGGFPGCRSILGSEVENGSIMSAVIYA
jgi:hypothetical protein